MLSYTHMHTQTHTQPTVAHPSPPTDSLLPVLAQVFMAYNRFTMHFMLMLIFFKDVWKPKLGPKDQWFTFG